MQLRVPNGHNNSGFYCESRTIAERDRPLEHVVRFIQNALRSWACHRLTSRLSGEHHQPQEKPHVEPRQDMCGLSRSGDFGNDTDPCFRTGSPTGHFNLAKTPEGAAIMAFEDVLHSGCLRINTSLPTELSRALQILYVQIEHLTQPHRNEPRWQYISYRDQITAHGIRLEQCKEELAEAQKEMALQRQLSATEVAQQMTVRLNVPRTRMIVEQAQQGHATELKRRRELDAAQQQQIIEPATNPSLHNSDAGIMFHASIATAGCTAAKARGKIMNVLPTQYSSTGHSIDADMSESDCRPPSISLHFLKDSSAPEMTNGMMNSRLAS